MIHNSLHNKKNTVWCQEDKLQLPNLVKTHFIYVGKETAVIGWEYDGNPGSSVDYYIEVLYRVFEKDVQRVQFKENVPKGNPLVIKIILSFLNEI